MTERFRLACNDRRPLPAATAPYWKPGHFLEDVLRTQMTASARALPSVCLSLSLFEATPRLARRFIGILAKARVQTQPQRHGDSVQPNPASVNKAAMHQHRQACRLHPLRNLFQAQSQARRCSCSSRRNSRSCGAKWNHQQSTTGPQHMRRLRQPRGHCRQGKCST